MFHGMGHTGHIGLIAEVADIAVEGGAGLVRVWVVHQKNLQLVAKPYHTIVPVIEGRSLELIGHTLYWARLRLTQWEL